MIMIMITITLTITITIMVMIIIIYSRQCSYSTKASGDEQTTETNNSNSTDFLQTSHSNYITLQKVPAIELTPSASGAAMGSTAERTAPTAGTTRLPTS